MRVGGCNWELGFGRFQICFLVVDVKSRGGLVLLQLGFPTNT